MRTRILVFFTLLVGLLLMTSCSVYRKVIPEREKEYRNPNKDYLFVEIYVDKEFEELGVLLEDEIDYRFPDYHVELKTVLNIRPEPTIADTADSVAQVADIQIVADITLTGDENLATTEVVDTVSVFDAPMTSRKRTGVEEVVDDSVIVDTPQDSIEIVEKVEAIIETVEEDTIEQVTQEPPPFDHPYFHMIIEHMEGGDFVANLRNRPGYSSLRFKINLYESPEEKRIWRETIELKPDWESYSLEETAELVIKILLDKLNKNKLI